MDEDKKAPVESYLTLETLQQLTDRYPDTATPSIPKKIADKLKYYSNFQGEDVPLTNITARDAIVQLIESEGKSPDDYHDLFAQLKKFEVVYPNEFLSERTHSYHVSTEFKPRGNAKARVEAIAGQLVTAITESTNPLYHPENTGLTPDAVTEHAYRYLGESLRGPFAQIIDISDDKPLLVLNDMSYTAPQLFRAFSGIYCDFTPIPKLSKADFLAFSIYHEIGHKKSEDIIALGNSNDFLPGIELGIEPGSMSHKNLTESIADVYAALKHIQRTGSDALPRQIATMRTLAAFSSNYQAFETPFSLLAGSASRRRVVSEYYTTPSLDTAIGQATALHSSGALQTMGDDELLKMAIHISREHKVDEKTLHELSALATTVNFNLSRYTPNPNIPHYKDSFSPSVVAFILDAAGKHGTFTPKGGDAIESILHSDSNKGLFQQKSIVISPEIQTIVARYKDACTALDKDGLKPFTQECNDYIMHDLHSTLGLVANQNPNMTLARECNDWLAGENKYTALNWHHFECNGTKRLLEATGADVHEHNFEVGSEYIRGKDRAEALWPVNAIVKSFHGQSKSKAL